MNFQSGQEITAGSTNETALELSSLLPGSVGPVVLELEVTSGTIKFGQIAGEVSSMYGRTSASGKFHMAHSPLAPIRFVAANAADKFVVTALG